MTQSFAAALTVLAFAVSGSPPSASADLLAEAAGDCRVDQPLSFELCPVTERVTGTGGAVYEMRVRPDGTIMPYRDGEPLASDRGMAFDLVAAPSGGAVWSLTRTSLAGASLMYNEQSLTDGRFLDHRAIADAEGHIWFIRRLPRPPRDQVCTIDLTGDLAGGEARCVSAGYFVERLVPASGDGVIAVGYDPDEDNYRVSLVQTGPSDRPAATEVLSSGQTLLVHDGQILRLSGSASLESLFIAYWAQRAGANAGRAVLGGNGTGRVAWAASYQLVALAVLAARTGDEVLAEHAIGLRRAILDQAQDGRFPAWRYSQDSETYLNHAVQDGVIHDALFRSCELLPGAGCEEAVQLARQSLRLIEADWSGSAYHWPCTVHLRYPGDRLPLNQQNAIGLQLAHLVRHAPEAGDIERLRHLRAAFLEETYLHEGVRIWPYWPRDFHSGQADRSHCEFSVPDEERRPLSAMTAEDTPHAHLNLRFDALSADVLGEERAVDIAGLMALVTLAPRRFAFFIDGSRPERASFDNRPYGGLLDHDEVLDAAYRRWAEPGRMPFDSHQQLAGYAFAAPSLADLDGELAVERIEFEARDEDGSVRWNATAIGGLSAIEFPAGPRGTGNDVPPAASTEAVWALIECLETLHACQ